MLLDCHVKEYGYQQYQWLGFYFTIKTALQPNAELQRIADYSRAHNDNLLRRYDEAGVPLSNEVEHYFGRSFTPESRRAFNQAVGEAVEQGRGLTAAEGGLGEVMDLNLWSTPDKQWVFNRTKALMRGGQGSDASAASMFMTRRPLGGPESFLKNRLFTDPRTRWSSVLS